MNVEAIARNSNFPQASPASANPQPSGAGADNDGADDGNHLSDRRDGFGGPGAFLDAVFQALAQIGAAPASTAPGTAAATSQGAQTITITETTTISISATTSPSTTGAASTATTSQTTGSSGTTAAADNTAAAENPLQALGAFLHNLFTALQSLFGSGSQTTSSENEHHHHGGGLSRLEAKLQSLIQMLSTPASATQGASSTPTASGSTPSATTPPATVPGTTSSATSSPPTNTPVAGAPAPTAVTTTTPPTATLPPAVVRLQQSYQVLLSSLGMSSSTSTLSSFLQALYQNLQGFRSSGNLLNTQA